MKHNVLYYLAHPDKVLKSLRVKFDERCAIQECWNQHNMGYPLNLDDPQTLNEKIQWLKLHDRKPLYTTLVDKQAVKDWLAEHFGMQYVIPTIAKYTSVDEIDFNALPQEFVLKCNHDSGSVVICSNKNRLDLDEVKNKFRRALQRNWYYNGREWCYKNIQKRLIIQEPLLRTKQGKLPDDYKLHYINGKLEFVYVSYDRKGVNDRCVYDADWNRMPFVWVAPYQYRENLNTSDVKCPPTFDKMKEIGSKIAQMFKLVRVDFYDVDGRLYIGEITLYHGSGYDHFYPQEYDLIYGQKLKLD